MVGIILNLWLAILVLSFVKSAAELATGISVGFRLECLQLGIGRCIWAVSTYGIKMEVRLAVLYLQLRWIVEKRKVPFRSPTPRGVLVKLSGIFATLLVGLSILGLDEGGHTLAQIVWGYTVGAVFPLSVGWSVLDAIFRRISSETLPRILGFVAIYEAAVPCIFVTIETLVAWFALALFSKFGVSEKFAKRLVLTALLILIFSLFSWFVAIFVFLVGKVIDS